MKRFFGRFLFFCLCLYPLSLSAQTTSNTPEKIFFTPAKSEKINDTTYRFYGTLDTTKHTEVSPIKLSDIVITADIFPSGKKDPADRLWPLTSAIYKSGIDEKGNYEFIVKDLPFNQNTSYDIWMTFKKGDAGTVIEDNKNKSRFSSSTGIIPETGKAAEDFINRRSYRLLAPIPGMTLLLDPELCTAEQEKNIAEGKDAGQICDINAFLNFLLSLAIGAAAVVLVLRIIIDGYGYMTTDIPFVKAKMKGQFVNALIGLVVALSSYLILNTISPRLVTNKVSIGKASFDVEESMILQSLGINPNSSEARLLSAEEIKKYKISYAGTKKYIKDVYIPARDAALPNASKGIKALMTAHMYVEGFFPGSMAERTNNPGNIGNQSGQQGEGGKRTCYATLEDGIKRQYQHFLKIANNNDSSYKLNTRRDGPKNAQGNTLAIAPEHRLFETLTSNYLTGYFAFIYDSSIWQYLYIYSPETTEKRKVYLSGVLSYLESEGIQATANTKISTFVTKNEPQITEPGTVACSQYAWTGKR